jgi:hypothetical protein
MITVEPIASQGGNVDDIVGSVPHQLRQVCDGLLWEHLAAALSVLWLRWQHWLCRARLWLRRGTLPVRRDGWPWCSLVARWAGWTNLLEVYVTSCMCQLYTLTLDMDGVAYNSNAGPQWKAQLREVKMGVQRCWRTSSFLQTRRQFMLDISM